MSALSDDELNGIRATWKRGIDDCGTSTLAYRALALVPKLFDEINRLKKELDQAQEGPAWRATLEDPDKRERLRGL